MEKLKQDFMMKVMNQGFQRAADAFGRLIGEQVSLTESSLVVIPMETALAEVSEEGGKIIVLTTQVIGAISGMSFLIFNEKELEAVFKNIKWNTDELRDAFLLEIDNIISASVISDISNALSIEVYGDVPNLERVQSIDLRPFMKAQVAFDDTDQLIFTKTTFHFRNAEDVHPQFIWKINSKAFDIISEEKIVA
jgi:chemotaxis protein CheY-P-specific phosphatase CheC